MFERIAEFDVFYVPWANTDPDQAIALGAQWLRQQPGQHLVLLKAKGMYTNNPNLPRLTKGALVERPQSVWQSDWRGGAVLAPWASETVLNALSGDLADQVTSVCVIEWGDTDTYRNSWLRVHSAVNLITGEPLSSDRMIDPVVEAAMRDLSAAVNHNNGLISYYEKAYAVRTLQVLVHAGYRYEVDALCGWAGANGFTDREVKELKTYAQRILEGRSFQLREQVGPRDDAIERWRRAAGSS